MKNIIHIKNWHLPYWIKHKMVFQKFWKVFFLIVEIVKQYKNLLESFH